MHCQPIAIIGLSGRYPGGAENVDRLWTNLKAGVDGIVDLPADRWDRGFMHPNRDRRARSDTFASGYIANVGDFAAEFFGISPREAQESDPQHRLLLEPAWEAPEDGNVVPAGLAGSRTGVFVGLSSCDHGGFSGEVGSNAYTHIGLSLSLASDRISCALDLQGPSFTIDTACSSGRVTVHPARLADELLPELGLDSLMAVELAQALEAEVGRTGSVMQMIQASSAVAVAELLLAGFEKSTDA